MVQDFDSDKVFSSSQNSLINANKIQESEGSKITSDDLRRWRKGTDEFFEQELIDRRRFDKAINSDVVFALSALMNIMHNINF